ncbi:MAG: hypothetical protein C4305_06330 [Thermoleophilia bacterium]
MTRHGRRLRAHPRGCRRDAGQPGGDPAGGAASRPEGLIRLACIVHLAPAVSAGWAAGQLVEELEREAGEALRSAQELVPQATSALVEGSPVVTLLRQIERFGATLVAVGTHGTSRPEAILLGGVTTTMVHEGPCSVLVARPGRQGMPSPGRSPSGSMARPTRPKPPRQQRSWPAGFRCRFDGWCRCGESRSIWRRSGPPSPT